MRTDDLMQALVEDGRSGETSLERRLVAALLIGFAVSAAMFQATLGPRPDIAAAIGTPRFVLKIIEAVLFAATAIALALRLSRPGAPIRAVRLAMLAAPALLIASVLAEL